MPRSTISTNKSLQIHWPIVYIGGFVGLFLSWMVLTGDEQGRVNLFYLLLVYLVIPVLSVFTSVFSLLVGKGVNLARLISSIPYWPSEFKTLIRKNQQLHLDKHWFLMQSQGAALAFSGASLVTFFTLLVATDLNFVWRSTILAPTDILPWLETVAWPWQFWSSAQPSLSLLEMTQDSRMITSNLEGNNYGVWWKFILATQVCYSFMLRLVLLFVTRVWLTRKIKSDFELTLQNDMLAHQPLANMPSEKSSVLHQIPENLALMNWDNISQATLSLLSNFNPSSGNMLQVNRDHLIKNETEQWVVVKAWEGPLGELEDHLKLGQGYLQPLDWNDAGLVGLQLVHLHEWQRFINNLPSWQLYVPRELMP